MCFSSWPCKVSIPYEINYLANPTLTLLGKLRGRLQAFAVG